MDQTPAKNDTLRQIVVAVSAVAAIIGSFIGSGAAGGTQIQNASNGALSADSTLIAPDGPAFSIWSVIYLGLVAYAVWQFLPKQKTEHRHRLLGYPVAASLLLNAAWILSVQFDLLPLSVPIIAVLLAVLAYIFVLTLRHRPSNTVDAIITDGTMGLYLGWVCVATAANISAVLVAVYGKGRLAPAASLGWGLAWVAVARFSGELLSTPAATAALVGAIVVVASTLLIRLRTVTTSTR